MIHPPVAGGRGPGLHHERDFPNLVNPGCRRRSPGAKEGICRRRPYSQVLPEHDAAFAAAAGIRLDSCGTAAAAPAAWRLSVHSIRIESAAIAAVASKARRDSYTSRGGDAVDAIEVAGSTGSPATPGSPVPEPRAAISTGMLDISCTERGAPADSGS